MCPSKRAHIAYLKVDKAFIEIASEYTDFVDVFLLKLAIQLPEHIKINNHTIKVVDD